MNSHTDSGHEFGNEFAEPVAHDVVIDTRLADTVEWIAKLAGSFASQTSAETVNQDSDVQDLRYCIAKAAATGEISAEHVVRSLADTLQALCFFGDEGFADFMTDYVATAFASVIRLDSPIREVPAHESTYRRFNTEPEDSSYEVVDLDVTLDATHRLGALIHNLRREPVGVNEFETPDGNGSLSEEWTIGAALNAATDGWENIEVTGQEVALTISLPIMALTEVFNWLDARVIDGLSSAALEFLKTEMLPSMLKHFSSEQTEAA